MLLADGLKLQLDGEGVRVRGKLIDGTFLPWQRVVPNTAEMRPIAISRTALLGALRIVPAVAPKGAGSMLLIDGGRLQLATRSQDGEVAIDIGPAAGAPIEIGINSHFGLMALVGSEVKAREHVVLMPLRAASRPTVLAPAPLAEAA